MSQSNYSTMIQRMERTCIACNETKSLADFPHVTGGNMSRGTKCKGCSTVYRENQKRKRFGHL